MLGLKALDGEQFSQPRSIELFGNHLMNSCRPQIGYGDLSSGTVIQNAAALMLTIFRMFPFGGPAATPLIHRVHWVFRTGVTRLQATHLFWLNS